jgi:hypothetical protein
MRAAPASAFRPRSRLSRPLSAMPRQPFRLVGLQRLERQLELLGLVRQRDVWSPCGLRPGTRLLTLHEQPEYCRSARRETREGPGVCRLAGGGKWIRTVGPTHCAVAEAGGDERNGAVRIGEAPTVADADAVPGRLLPLRGQDSSPRGDRDLGLEFITRRDPSDSRA